MVIGNGLVGSALKEHEWDSNLVFFASGVSNSKTNSVKEFTREKNLLFETIEKYNSSVIVYFSTCSIYDKKISNSAYVHHKLNMEKLLTEKAHDYRIVRITNLVGRSENQNTILNFFVNMIRDNKPFELWEGIERNLLDINHFVDLLKIVLSEVGQNKLILLYNKYSIDTKSIVVEIELFLNKKGNYKMINGIEKSQAKVSYAQSSYIDNYFPERDNSNEYLRQLLNSYYN